MHSSSQQPLSAVQRLLRDSSVHRLDHASERGNIPSKSKENNMKDEVKQIRDLSSISTPSTLMQWSQILRSRHPRSLGSIFSPGFLSSRQSPQETRPPTAIGIALDSGKSFVRTNNSQDISTFNHADAIRMLRPNSLLFKRPKKSHTMHFDSIIRDPSEQKQQLLQVASTQVPEVQSSTNGEQSSFTIQQSFAVASHNQSTNNLNNNHHSRSVQQMFNTKSILGCAAINESSDNMPSVQHSMFNARYGNSPQLRMERSQMSRSAAQTSLRQRPIGSFASRKKDASEQQLPSDQRKFKALVLPSREGVSQPRNVSSRLQKISTQLFPVSLQLIQDKPFKNISPILRFGITNQISTGPRLAASELQLFTIFRRLIDSYHLAIKQAEYNETHSLGISTVASEQAELAKKLLKKITEICEVFLQIYKIKGYQVNPSTSGVASGLREESPKKEPASLTSSEEIMKRRVYRMILDFFQNQSYLAFLFFKTEEESLFQVSLDEVLTGSDVLMFTPLFELMAVAPERIFARLTHENFKKFFAEKDFEVLLEWVVLPDLQALHERAAAFIYKYYSNSIDGISQQVENTMGSIFSTVQSLLYKKKNPSSMRDAFQLSIPSFTAVKRATNKVVVRDNQLTKLDAMFTKKIDGLSRTLHKYLVTSPYSPDVDSTIKAQLVNMYNNQNPQ